MIGVISLVLGATACSNEEVQSDLAAESSTTSDLILASAKMRNSSDAEIGSVKLLDRQGTLFISAVIAALPSGDSGFHLHETGLCDGPDFTSAGGHLNPFEREHGRDNPKGKHTGDLPNLKISSDGGVRQEIALQGDVEELLAAIADEDGTAVVVHQDADDYATDPTGNAGPRIACGVLTAPVQ